MTPGGELEAEIVTRAGVVSEVRIVATRRVPLSAALRGKSVAEAVTLVPLLFATCGIAHGVAASAAVRSATGEGEGAAGGPRARRA
jgi:coenzyme F420-reducing hydrogenase alpha subunit